jgi:putative tricarboxylic transport membrane protein
MMNLLRRTALTIGALLVWGGHLRADDTPVPRTVDGYPNRPLMIMAPANPGGGWDQTSRVMQHVLVNRKIAPVSVEVFNRGGAGGTIGLAELVSRHRRDPHVIMTAGLVMVGAIEAHHSPFTLKDTVPLARLVSEYEVVAVPPSSPYRSLRALLDAWKAEPRSITWGGGSAGGIDHILVGLLARDLAIPSGDVRYVAFAGGGEAAAAVMGGQVTAAISGYGEWKGLADGGRMRMLATSSAKRITADAPPSFREEGVDLDLANWRCVLAPPDTSVEARAWLVDALRRMRETPEWQTYLKNNYWEDSFLEGAEFQQFLDREIETTKSVLATINLGQGGEGYAAVGPWTFPSVVFAGLLISMVFVLRSGAPPLPAREAPIQTTPLLITAALLVTYALAFERIGFVAATSLFMALEARVLGSRRWVRDLIVSIAVTIVAYVLFDRLLNVKLPWGEWLSRRAPL